MNEHCLARSIHVFGFDSGLLSSSHCMQAGRRRRRGQRERERDGVPGNDPTNAQTIPAAHIELWGWRFASATPSGVA